MKIAIVGTSNLTEDEKLKVIYNIETILARNPDSMIITGDADGVDKLVRTITPKNKLTVEKSYWNSWDYFKERNIRIVLQSDLVYSITTKVKKERCYHCNKDHERTGGCWTMHRAINFGKKGEVIVI